MLRRAYGSMQQYYIPSRQRHGSKLTPSVILQYGLAWGLRNKSTIPPPPTLMFLAPIKPTCRQPTSRVSASTPELPPSEAMGCLDGVAQSSRGYLVAQRRCCWLLGRSKTRAGIKQ